AVGLAMFGGAVFMGQYFQLARGYSPAEAGLMTLPLMLGTLISSTVAGRMVSRSGRVKSYVVTGMVMLTAGFTALSFLEASTPLPYVALGMALAGIGVGMSMQNLVLVVQNSVPLRDVGAASGAVAFFRSLGGTTGVSVLGAVLASRVATTVGDGLDRAGVDPASAAAAGSDTLNMQAMPPVVREIVAGAYGSATGDLFLVAMGVAVVGPAVPVVGHRCAGRVVPRREQGAGQGRQGRKVCVRQGCGQAGVLHSDLDAHRAAARLGQLADPAHQVTQDKTERVVHDHRQS